MTQLTKQTTQSPTIKVTVLGSGTSMGVPVIGCRCRTCTSDNPRNRRMRSSIKIEIDGRHLLVDCSIDFREQMLRYPMPRIDALLLTHTHSDHINGLDDMRPYNYYQRSAIPIYSTEYFLDDLTGRFHYAFNPLQKGGGVPQMNLEVVEPGEQFRAAGVEVLPVEIMHGRLPILGFRIGEFAYLTDCSEIPPETFAHLRGVKTIILDALRWRPHSTHFTVVQALAAARQLEVERVFFTHIADELEHDFANALLPPWAQLAYDGLELEVPR